MRFISLACKAGALLALYAFACGAFGPDVSADPSWHSVFHRLMVPVETIGPWTLGIVSLGIFLLGVGKSFEPDPWKFDDAEEGGPFRFWSGILLSAFCANTIIVCGTAALILTGSRSVTGSKDLGALFLAGVFEVGLGIILATALIFCRRPRGVFAPVLSLFFAGTISLGAMFWLGNGALP